MYLSQLEAALSEHLALDAVRTRAVARRMQDRGELPKGRAGKGGAHWPVAKPDDVIRLTIARALDLDPTTAADLARQFCDLPLRGIHDEAVECGTGRVIADGGLRRVEDCQFAPNDAAAFAPMCASLLAGLRYALLDPTEDGKPGINLSMVRSAGAPLVVIQASFPPFDHQGGKIYRRTSFWYGDGPERQAYGTIADRHYTEARIGPKAMRSIADLVKDATEPDRRPFVPRSVPSPTDAAAAPARGPLASETAPAAPSRSRRGSDANRRI